MNEPNMPIQNQVQPPPPPPAAPNDRKTLAIISLICGILSIVISCAWYVGIIVGIVAIVLGAMSMKSSGRGMAIGGLICGIIGILAGIGWLVAVLVVGVAAGY